MYEWRNLAQGLAFREGLHMQPRQVFSAYDYRCSNQEGKGYFTFCPRCGEKLQKRMVAELERPCCPTCDYIQYRNPLPAVSALICDGDMILLGKRGSGSIEAHRWCLPCGFIEYDEDFLTAARREVKEETGLDIRPIEIINVAFNFLKPEVHTLVAVLRAVVTGGLLQANDDMAELRWFTLDEPLPPLAFEADGYIIERYRRGIIQGLPVQE